MAQDVTIAGASYEDVSGIEVPKTGNNAGTALFNDVSDTTAVADDVVQGKYFYNAAGVKTAGTRSASSLDPDVSNENLLLDSTVTPVIDTPDRLKTFKVPTYTTFSNYKLLSSGIRSYDTTATCYEYSVAQGQILYLKISADTPAVYQFQSTSTVPTSGNNLYIIGNVVTTAVDDFITVPANATYLVVSVLKTNSTFEVKSSMIDPESIDDITRITLPDASAYDIKDSIARQRCIYGYVDTNGSTAYNYNIVAPGIIELRSGTMMFVHNIMNSTSYPISLNVNNLGSKGLFLLSKPDSQATGTEFTYNKTHLVVYDEYYYGGIWFLVDTPITTSLVSGGKRVPSEGAVVNYVSNQLNDRLPDVTTDSSGDYIYITENSGVSSLTVDGNATNRWPNDTGGDTYDRLIWIRIVQTYPESGFPSRIVPASLLVTEVIDRESTYASENIYDYVLYSQMLHDGYYEFHFTFNYDYYAYDVVWYFRPVSGGSGTPEVVSNKVTSLSAQSTDTQYPSAKCVYDIIGDVESALLALR